MHKEEEAWPILRDMLVGVADPWVLNKARITRASVPHSWTNRQAGSPVLLRHDRFYIPVEWMQRVCRAEIIVGNFKSDHFPMGMEVQPMAPAPPRSAGCLEYFGLNLSVALSASGKAGVLEILKHWTRSTAAGSALLRLQSALIECQNFLRELGKELARTCRRRELGLRRELQSLLILVPGKHGEELAAVMQEVQQVQGKLDAIDRPEALQACAFSSWLQCAGKRTRRAGLRPAPSARQHTIVAPARPT